MNRHTLSLAARALPQVSSRPFLTDGGMETTLVFHQEIDLPHFAAFPLLDSPKGRDALRDYFAPYLALASRHGAGFILDTPTWRASEDWGKKLGYDTGALDRVNRDAVDFADALRGMNCADAPVLLSGVIGPRGDGYRPDALMNSAQAEAYHALQVASFADSQADMISAMTMTHAGEAIGIVLAARSCCIPVVVSFTVDTDGRLPSGQTLGEAIEQTDAATDGYAAYFMINCAHPDHFTDTLRDGPWRARVRGVRANASRCSHAELDEAEKLDEGNPMELGAEYQALKRLLPQLSIFGGCCGTDLRHIAAIADACIG